MKFNKELILQIITVYLCLSGIAVIFGVFNAGWNLCDRPKSKLRTIFPTYEVGCWLMEPVSNKKRGE